MPVAKLSSKSQVVLPVKIRRRLDINPGDLLEIREENKKIIIVKAPSSIVDALDQCGSKIWENYADELLISRQEWD